MHYHTRVTLDHQETYRYNVKRGPLWYDFIVFLDKYGFLCIHVEEDGILFNIASKPHLMMLWSCGKGKFEGQRCIAFEGFCDDKECKGRDVQWWNTGTIMFSWTISIHFFQNQGDLPPISHACLINSLIMRSYRLLMQDCLYCAYNRLHIFHTRFFSYKIHTGTSLLYEGCCGSGCGGISRE